MYREVMRSWRMRRPEGQCALSEKVASWTRPPSKTSQFDTRTFGKWLPVTGPNIVMKITIVVKTQDSQEPKSPGDRR